MVVCVRESELHPGGVSAESPAGPVGAESLRRLACDSSVTRVTVDADDSPLDVGRKLCTVSDRLGWMITGRWRLLDIDACCFDPLWGAGQGVVVAARIVV